MKRKKLDKWWVKKKGHKLGRKGLVKKLDDIFSQFIRKRDGRCVLWTTGQCNGILTNGHLFSRVSYSTRWSEKNCHAQCGKHNMIHESNPHIFTSWFIHAFGIDAYDILLLEHNKCKKFKDYEIADMIKLYEEKLNQLPNG